MNLTGKLQQQKSGQHSPGVARDFLFFSLLFFILFIYFLYFMYFIYFIKFNKFNSFNSFNSIQFRSLRFLKTPASSSKESRHARTKSNLNAGWRKNKLPEKKGAGMLARSRTQVGEKTCSQKRTKLEKNQTILIQKRKANGRKACLTLAVTSQCRIVGCVSQVGVARKPKALRSRTQRQF